MRSHATNIFTVDVEEWFHANYEESVPIPPERDYLVLSETERLLELLAHAQAKGTFFVLGETAARYPELVRSIAQAGHEIASHNFRHDLVYEMDQEAFRQQARESKAVLEELSGKRVIGFRAPSWSVGKKTPWFWKELADAGYLYSSSLFPFANFLYGDSQAPRFAHKRDGIVELPPTTAQLFGKRVPFSGGFYLRAAPRPLIAGLSRRVNREKEPVIYYIHPREIDPDQPRIPLNISNRLIHYWGIRGTERKLKHILSSSSFQTMAELYELVA